MFTEKQNERVQILLPLVSLLKLNPAELQVLPIVVETCCESLNYTEKQFIDHAMKNSRCRAYLVELCRKAIS